jgi:uncharacterized protein (DUF1697 family)
MNHYLALLRGINVGGKNIIKMADLKTSFEWMGFSGVATYIQSGNVLFESAESDRSALTGKIEHGLSRDFEYSSKAVIVSADELAQIIREAPRGFGDDLETYRCDVIFLKEPLTPAEAILQARVKPGVDFAQAGTLALYFSRLTARASQSHLTKIIGTPVYQSMTIRNWNTTTKLFALMEKE